MAEQVVNLNNREDRASDSTPLLKVTGQHPRTVLAIEHVEVETPGLIADLAAARGINVNVCQTWRGDTVPTDPRPYLAVVVMGGPMGVDEVAEHPHLGLELDLICNCLEAAIPVGGVCLGAQLLAVAAGGTVFKTGQFHLGWSTAVLTDLGKRVMLTDIQAFPVLEWHEDYYSLPASATCLATSESNEIFAFGLPGGHLGLLPHVEVTPDMLEHWVSSFGMPAEPAAASDLLGKARAFQRETTEVATQIWGSFLDRATARA